MKEELLRIVDWFRVDEKKARVEKMRNWLRVLIGMVLILALVSGYLAVRLEKLEEKIELENRTINLETGVR